MRVLFVLLVVGLLISGDSFTAPARAEAAYQLRIATLAPRQSPLGEEYSKLKTGMRDATDGQVNMKMYFGGVAGDEITVVRKMRVGQLDGALITSTGLSALVRQVLVLEAPGLMHGAGSALFLRDGRLHYLEIYARGGFFPEQPESYRLQWPAE